MTTGHRLFRKEILCFDTTPCRHMPFLVHYTILYHTILYYPTLYYTILCYIIIYYTIRYCALPIAVDAPAIRPRVPEQHPPRAQQLGQPVQDREVGGIRLETSSNSRGPTKAIWWYMHETQRGTDSSNSRCHPVLYYTIID